MNRPWFWRVEYQVKDLLTGLEFTHTEFPPHWTVERIAQEIRMACEKAIKDGLLDEDKLVAKIAVEDGFDLKIVTNRRPINHTCESIENTINRHVVTARPDKVKVKK